DNKELLKEIVGDIDIDLQKMGDVIPLVKPVPEDMHAWASIALQNNLQIISGFNGLEIKRKEVRKQWNGYLPSIDIVGNYGLTDNQSSFGLRGNTSSIGVQLNLPIFEGGTTQSRIRGAEYEYKIEEQALETTRRQVKTEVRNAYRGILSDMSRIGALKEAVVAAEQAVEGVKMGFSEGTRTMVDVLVEQRALYRNKVDYTDARYTYLLHGLSLKKGASSLSLADMKAVNDLLR
ncbi:MAG: TolC family protein, partial [Methyloprofundus sp.]|nr:TolC family protein [Methyloprofundus sp.]